LASLFSSALLLPFHRLRLLMAVVMAVVAVAMEAEDFPAVATVAAGDLAVAVVVAEVIMVVAVEAMAAVPSTTVVVEAMAAVPSTTVAVESMVALASIPVAETMVVASITDITAGSIITMAAMGAITVATEPIITRPTPTRIMRMANVRGSTGRP
jgi:hypothetical protein